MESSLGDSHVQLGMKSAVLEKHQSGALFQELHLSAGASWVCSHLLGLQGGRDFRNYELHPGCR